MVPARSARTIQMAVALTFAVILPAPVRAQQPVSSLEELKVLQSTNSPTIVTDTTGREFRGALVEASRAGLSLRVGGKTQPFAVADVRSVRVRKEDSLANGALIGLVVSAGLSSLIFLDNECHDDAACYVGVALNSGLGALTGTAIDALIHRHVVVYTAPASGGRTGLTVAPVAMRTGAGVRVTLAF